MDEETFLAHTAKVATCLIENAAHCYGVPILELNELLIEINRRQKIAENWEDISRPL